MKQTPQLFNADELVFTDEKTLTTIHDDKKQITWILARPWSIDSWPTRFRLAWGVFFGKYDALKWNGDQ